MLNKLLKYDLKWCYKNLIVFYILDIVFSIITRAVGSLEESLFVIVMKNILFGTMIAMTVNILINFFMRNWAGFVINVYKDEGYLTNTLPVSKNKIFLSKVLASAITLITSFVVIFGCLGIAYLNENTWNMLKDVLEKSSILLDSSIVEFLSIVIITLFFELLFLYMSGLLGIILGHRSNNLKIVKSILLGFVIYMVLSSLSIGLLYISGLVNPNIMEIFNSNIITSKTVKDTMVIGIAIYAIYNILIYCIGDRAFKKGINID